MSALPHKNLRWAMMVRGIISACLPSSRCRYYKIEKFNWICLCSLESWNYFSIFKLVRFNIWRHKAPIHVEASYWPAVLGTECGGAGCPRPRTGCGWRGGPLCGSCHVSHVTHVSTATITRTRAGHAHCSALATSGPQHSQPRHLKQIKCLQSDKLQQYYCADNGGVRYSLEVSTIFREYVYNILIMPISLFHT